MMHHHTRVFLLGTTAALLSGCAPYMFSGEVQGFGAGVQSLRSAYVDGMAQADRDLASRYRWDWLTDPTAQVVLTPICGAAPVPPGSKTPRCELQRHGTTAPSLARLEQTVPDIFPTIDAAQEKFAQADQQIRQALDALAGYAAALGRITDATDRANLIAAQDKIEGALGSIASAAGAPFAVAVAPAANLFNRLIVISLDQRRYAALESATTRVDPALGKLAEALTLGLERARDRRLDELNALAPVLTRALVGKPWAERQVLLDQLQDTATQIESLRRSNPAATVQRMIDAHHALTQAVVRSKGAPDLASVLAQVQGFAQDAGALVDALQTIR